MAKELKEEDNITSLSDISSEIISHTNDKIEIHIECLNLPKSSSITHNSTFVVLTLLDPYTNRYLEAGRTETIQNNLSPKFSEILYINYFFEKKQILQFNIYSINNKLSINHNATDLSKMEFIGTSGIVLGSILKNENMMIKQKIINDGKIVKNKNNDYSEIIIKCEKYNENEFKTQSSTVMIGFDGIDLPKMDAGLASLSDPYLEIWRCDKNSDKKIFCTEIIKRTLNPVWNKVVMNTYQLCRNDRANKIILKVYDWDKNSEDDFIGQCSTTLTELSKSPTITLTNLTKKSKKKNKTPKIKISYFKEIPNTIIDYLCSGTEIDVIFGVDYTYSNGNYNDNKSLHFIGDGWKLTPYGNAIKSIGEILECYDTDKKFPLYGFGGKLVDHNKTQDIFAVNGDDNNPYENGIDSLHQLYVDTLKFKKIVLGNKLDPTNFAPIISKVIDTATKSKKLNENKYFVLVIITDGLIDDIRATKKLIISAANEPLPISIIIIGVGNADFKKMDELDGDNEKLSLISINGIEYAKRDIVQFVAMREKQNHLDLANETLKEIPKQMMSYFMIQNILPKNKNIKNINEFNNKYLLNNGDDNLEKLGGFQVEKDPGKQALYDEIDLPENWKKLYDKNGFCYFQDKNGKLYKDPPGFTSNDDDAKQDTN